MPTQTLDPLELIREMPTLGSPPAVYHRLVEVLDDPRSGPHEIAAVVGQALQDLMTSVQDEFADVVGVFGMDD